jgi:3-hydroxyisobutyrate dehydrogenase
MVGGAQEHFARCEQLLRAMGRAVMHVGASGCGHAVKALNNYVSAAGLIATAEAVHAAKAFGVDPYSMADVLNGSTGRNNTTENKLKQFMLSGSFDAGFALQLMRKDLATAMSLAEGLGLTMPLAEKVLELWHEACEQLPSDADHTAYFQHAAKATGPGLSAALPPPAAHRWP